MNPSPEDRAQRLERLVQQTVHGLPPRRAPDTLADRVLAELERRAALPWWRKSYVDWPLAVRCAFLIAAGGIAKVAVMVVTWALLGFQTAPLVDRLSALADLGGSLIDFCQAIFLSIPPVWLYSGLVAVVAMYVTLFGVGAFAYRTLYAKR